MNQKKEMYSNFYHCDHYLKTMYKIFINLDEVIESDGPLHAFTGKIRAFLLKKHELTLP
tara:strand:+ start:129 stop:305 length:177 start_codon:yes stop_codon:yes gene_type:complete